MGESVRRDREDWRENSRSAVIKLKKCECVVRT